MRVKKPSRRHAGLWLGTVAMLSGLALNAGPATAQNNPVSARPAKDGGAPRLIAFDIPAQDLNGALLSFADRAGVQIFYEATSVQGLRSAPVAGTLSAQQALGQLLAGTGFTFRFTGSGRVVLERIAAEGALHLDPVQVAGALVPETATSPIQGYVAKRSATGTKTDTPLLETPQSISVVGRQQMEEQGIQNLNDALRYTSGVITETRGAIATRYDLMRVRGFDSITYLDGLKLQKLNFIAPQVDSYLLERAEVLKGPASVMYGQAPAGGMVNQVLKVPTDAGLNEAGLEWGNNNHWVGTFDMAGAANADKSILYRVTAVGRSENGQIDNTESERVAIAPAVTFRGKSGSNLTLNALFQRDPHANTYAGVPAAGSVQGNRNGDIPRDFNVGEEDIETYDRTQVSAGYQFSHPVSDAMTVRLNGRWLRSWIDYASVYGTGLQANQRTLNRSLTVTHDELDTLNFDNQVESRIETGPVAHTVLTGLDYQQWSGFYDSGSVAVTALDIFNPVYGTVTTRPVMTRTDAEGTQTGLYMQDQATLGGWQATLAGRMDWAKSRTATRGNASAQSDRAFTGRAALLYLFDNGVAPYISYAESFTPQAGTDAAGKPFDPEEGRQYELGAKYQPPGLDSLFTAALFDVTRKNLLTRDPTATASVQTGEARSRGLELEAKVNHGENWNTIASYTYLDTIYTKDKSGLEGNHLYGIPRHMVSAWSHYTIPEGRLGGLGLGAGVRYMSDTYNSNNTIKVQDFAVVDAGVNYDLGHASEALVGTELSMNVKNLFDREYVASCYTNTTCAYGYGRTVTANVKMRW